MKAVIQRVNYARLRVNGNIISEINKGLMVLLGVGINDTEKDAIFFANKLASMRIFEDENEKLNLSVNDVKGKILLVSNFTLFGEALKGNRPSFSNSAKSDVALPLFNLTAQTLNNLVPTVTGVFGADMKIEMEADGPITIILDNTANQ